MGKKLSKKILHSDWFQKLVPTVVTAYIKFLGSTLRYKIIGEDNVLKLQNEGRSMILTTWHGTIMPSLFYMRNRDYHVIASYHRDGRFIAEVLWACGWQVISGSSGKNGLKAFLGLIKRIREGKITALTADGPRGPARELKMGALQAAKKTGVPIIPVLSAAYPCQHINSWDSFFMPYPFAKAVVIFGDPYYIDKDATDEELQAKKEELQIIFADLEKKAQELAHQ